MPGAAEEFDPFDGLEEEDRAYLDGHRKAFSKQKAIHDAYNTDDDSRRKAAEAHIRATQAAAGVTPSVPTPGTPPPRAASSQAQVGHVSILVAKPDSGAQLPPTTEKYAPDWSAMKEIIAKYDGTWIVSRHEFSNSVANILGFFGKDGWEKPTESEKERFEVIVKSGRVFRTDPE